jgi:hypothetical protein
MAVAPSAESVQAKVEQRIDQEQDVRGPDLASSDEIPLPDATEVTGQVDTTGGAVENLADAGGVEGAIDRLTWEIAQSLHERKTTVIWLFDRSLSLKDRRDAIADRFENVYRQLESRGEGGKGSLMSIAATYGDGFSLLNEKPTEDVKSLIPKVRAIANDPSGRENVFGAVHQLVTRFKGERSRGRNVRIFIITDEKGDDAEKHLEEVINLSRRSGIRIYVVGNAAAFGREKSTFRWTYSDGTTEDLEVDTGPETFRPEALSLPYWGRNYAELTRMSSGYGPYGLTRLCKETGGMYLIAQEVTGGPKFSPAVMRNYQPDYSPIREYAKSLEKNKAKAALVSASEATKIGSLPELRFSFPAYNEAVFKAQMAEAQKPVAEFTYKVEQLATLLLQAEKDREKIAESRWRAAYDLAAGRSLALKVRSFGYNKMLADMRQTPKTFQRKDSNDWRIVPSAAINAGQEVKKLERAATTYLKRVIDEHPDTPWALLAARELEIPMGWEWQEQNNPAYFPANTSEAEAQRRVQLADDEAREMAKKRPATPPAPARERPKL